MVAVNVAAIAINIVGVKQCFKEGTLVVCLNENGEEVQVCRRFWGEKIAGRFSFAKQSPGLNTNT